VLLAVALKNEGACPAGQVFVDAIHWASRRTEPKTLPLALGAVAPGGRAVIRATFRAAGQAPARKLVIFGRARCAETWTHFRVAREVATPRTTRPLASKSALAFPRTVSGASFQPVPVETGTLQDDEDEADEVPPLPADPRRIDERPKVPATSLKFEPDQLPPMPDPNDPVVFGRHQIVGAPNTFRRPPEPTGATRFGVQTPVRNADVVFVAGNTHAAFSLDGGATFDTLDPTGVFPFRDSSGTPIDGGGLCCDQVVQYVPAIDRYVWLMMTWPRRDASGLPLGRNRLRIASATPREIVDGRGATWTYFDLTPATFGWSDTQWFDFPDLSFGGAYLYVSAKVIDTAGEPSGRGLMVARVPLVAVQDAARPVPVTWIDPEPSASAMGSRLLQGAREAMYWAGHLATSQVQVFTWPESSWAASSRLVGVSPWSDADYVSIAPDGVPWLPMARGRGNRRIVGAALRSGPSAPGDRPRELWFAWDAGRSPRFPHPYIELLRLDAADLSVIEQSAVWNADHAFAYPALAVNQDNEVGIAAAWGGGRHYGNTAVGILGDFVLWITGVSDRTATVRVASPGDGAISVFGDYLTVRPHSPDATLFSGHTYRVRRDDANPGNCSGAFSDCRFDVLFTLFGRRSRVER
jgi:hypothetical protein